MKVYNKILLLLCVLFFLKNTSADIEVTKNAYHEKFHILILREPLSFDFQAHSQYTTLQLGQYTHDPLFSLKDGKPIPILIADYKWQTPTHWLFTLKKGVKFHDGTELTSKDIVATFNRAFKLENHTYKFIKNYQIKALNKYQFEIDTQSPNSELLWDLEDVLILKHTTENLKENASDYSQLLIGTGPYKLINHKDFKYFEFDAFADYHREQAYLRHVILEVETDENKQVDAFLNGKADMIYVLSEDKISKLKTKSNITSKTNHHLRMIFLDVYRDQSPNIVSHSGEPLTESPLKDLRVRQAISKALDRDILIYSMFGSDSSAKPAGQMVNDETEWSDPTLKPEKQDIITAKRLLKDAGYEKGFQVTVHNVDTPRRKLLIQLIADMLAKVGITVKVEMVPLNEYITRMNNNEYAFSISSYTTDGNLAEMLMQKLYSGSKSNNGRYSNSLHDSLVDKAMSQTSDTIKKRLLHQAQRVAIEDLALIPLYFESDNWAIRPDMVYEPTDQYYTEAYYVRQE